MNHKNTQKKVKSFTFMRNLSWNFATDQYRLVLRQWRLNPKEMEGKNCSFTKHGHEPL